MASSSCSPSRPLASPEPGFCLVTLSGPQFSISRGERSIQMPHPPARPSLLLLTRCHILLSGPASFSSPDVTSSCPARPPSPHRIPHPPVRPGLLLLSRCHILLPGLLLLTRCHILLPGPASFSSPDATSSCPARPPSSHQLSICFWEDSTLDTHVKEDAHVQMWKPALQAGIQTQGMRPTHATSSYRHPRGAGPPRGTGGPGGLGI
ncbi:uncharacterized protein LOC112131255 [Pongo abelii]|uniref:uncharacterized protein LOC112131255 n=1 Tax=Pongo abelii TaxID=9601 RepID=UPI00300751FF